MNIKFDNYDIDLDALNQDLAESSSTYLDSKRWAKDPEARAKWNQAYNDINSRGITGFSTSNGRYALSHNGVAFEDPDGYYADAANFIISRAKNILNASKAKEVEPKNLEEFGRFQDRLGAYIVNTNYGGDKNLMGRHWSSMDSHDEYGLYETTKRKEALKKALQDYGATLEDNKYSFEGTSYNNLNDLKSKIDAAIVSLDNPNNTDYTALHQLGIDENLWFPTNEEAATKARTAAEEKLAAENKAKQAKEAALANQKRANQYKTFRFIDMSRLNGTPPSGADVQARLNSYYSLPRLNGQQQSELVGAFKYAQKNGLLRNLDRDELSKFGDIYINNPTRLKKIKGVEGFYYDSIGNRIIQPFQGAAPQQNLQDVINENSPEALKEKQKKQAEVNMNTPLSQMTEWTPEMKKEMEAIAWDVASILDPEAFSGSTMALYASHLRDEANPNRGTLEKWFDRGTAALGGIQGIGDLLVTGKVGYRLYQLGKSIGSVSKFAGMLGAGFGAIGAFEARDSIAKLTNPSSLTPQDIENISYGLMGLIGLKSFAKARNKQTIGKQTNPTIAEHNITINDKNGSHVIKVDEATAKEINNSYKFGRNNKTKSDAKTFNHEKVKKAVEEYNKNPENTKKIDLESASIQSSSKFGITTEKPVKTKYVRDPNAPEYAPVGTKYWFDPLFHPGYIPQGNNKFSWMLGGWQRKAWENAVPEHSSKGLWQRAKEIWSPEPKPIQSKPKEKIDESKLISVDSNKETSPYAKRPLDTNPTIMNTKSSPEPVSYNRETMSRYNDAISGRFGKESLQSGNVKVGENGDLKVVQQTDGTYNIYFKGNQIGNERNQVEIQRVVSNVIKQLNKKDSQFGKVSAKEMGEILRSLKAKGWLRHGGKLIKV